MEFLLLLLLIFIIAGFFALNWFTSEQRKPMEKRISKLELQIHDLRSRLSKAEKLRDMDRIRMSTLESYSTRSKVEPKPLSEIFGPPKPESKVVERKELIGTRESEIVDPNPVPECIIDEQSANPKGVDGDVPIIIVSKEDGDITPSKIKVEHRAPPETPNKPKALRDPKTKNKNPIGTAPNDPLTKLFTFLKANWMIALGGLSVALAGIFLAKLAMEQGYFGPGARIALGIATGLALHISAEYFRRKTGEPNPVFGALAGGGSITLFAVLLVAMNYYDLLPREIGIVLLVAVAMGTMLLAIVHGPALAAIGIVGAYIVPLFVSRGATDTPLILLYSAIVTASGLFLLNYVFRNWLWNGVFLGALAWWVMSLATPDLAIHQGLYLAAVFYLFLAVPHRNWLLKQTYVLEEKTTPFSFFTLPNNVIHKEHILVIGLLLVLAIQFFAWPYTAHMSTAIYAWTPLFLLSLLAARKRESFTLIPWAMVLLELVGFMSRLTSLEGEEANTRILFSLVVAIISVVFGAINLREGKDKFAWSTFITGVPGLLALTCYFGTSGISDEKWALVFIPMTIIYGALAIFSWQRKFVPLFVSALFCGHFSASLAAVMLSENSVLTLAFALQLVPLAWIIKQFKIEQVGWLFQLLTAIVVVRLTVNPWLLDYDFSTHWSLFAYGGSLACSVFSMHLLNRYPKIRNWAELASMLFLVLFLWSELRYWFHDGEIFAMSASLLERSLTMVLFTGLSFFYYRRSLISERLKDLYQIFSGVMLLGTVLAYLSLLWGLFSQGEWFVSAIGSTPIFNMILLGFGVPILLGWLLSRYHEPTFKIGAIGFAAFAAFVFINLEIRHLWQGSLDFSSLMSNGESYTYSIVWLVAIGVIYTRLLDKYPKIRDGVEAAAMLLLVLFSLCELRFWLHGDVVGGHASMLERVLTMVVFAGLSMFYHKRSLVSERLKTLYRISSVKLLLGIVVTYLSLLTGLLGQADWFVSAIGSTPIFNMILLGFGLPILLSWLVSRFHESVTRVAAIGFGAIAVFVFINLEIRHLWQGSLDLSSAMGNAELYTYSIVWMSIAIGTTLAGALRNDKRGQDIYQFGMGLLGLVILKIFVVDTSNLDGILRVISFMGLGLSLLGLAYVHQRIKPIKKLELIDHES